LWEGRRTFSPLRGIFVDRRLSSYRRTLERFRSSLKSKNNSTFIHDTRKNRNDSKNLNHMEGWDGKRMSGIFSEKINSSCEDIFMIRRNWSWWLRVVYGSLNLNSLNVVWTLLSLLSLFCHSACRRFQTQFV
jgi:hypothetical protein